LLGDLKDFCHKHSFSRTEAIGSFCVHFEKMGREMSDDTLKKNASGAYIVVRGESETFQMVMSLLNCL
jgi:hypothetical protein